MTDGNRSLKFCLFFWAEHFHSFRRRERKKSCWLRIFLFLINSSNTPPGLCFSSLSSCILFPSVDLLKIKKYMICWKDQKKTRASSSSSVHPPLLPSFSSFFFFLFIFTFYLLLFNVLLDHPKIDWRSDVMLFICNLFQGTKIHPQSAD